jgi:hypothetical protein
MSCSKPQWAWSARGKIGLGRGGADVLEASCLLIMCWTLDELCRGYYATRQQSALRVVELRAARFRVVWRKKQQQ